MSKIPGTDVDKSAWLKRETELMPSLNPNRGKDKTMATNKRRLKDEIQRLTTYNTMVLDMLRELLDYHEGTKDTMITSELRDILKRARKVAA